MNEKEYLFSKNISNHPVSALKELYREVGLSFEAVGIKKSHELSAGTVARTVCIAKCFYSYSSLP
jgi:ABC-type glutathione transport system ATPase component